MLLSNDESQNYTPALLFQVNINSKNITILKKINLTFVSVPHIVQQIHVTISFLEQWFLTWVLLSPRGSASQFQGFFEFEEKNISFPLQRRVR